uniref:HNH nuclease domain-containing protein n=1 Tax=viral metagenome TaxID=1070528 RepID=A0A6C0HVZ1_9ZZZZ
MRIELWLFLICALVLANIYTEGKYIKNIFRWKKYFQMAGIVLGTLFLYYLIKRNPMKTGEILQTSNEYIKYLPMDRSSVNMLGPILDFTAKQNRGGSPPQVQVTNLPAMENPTATQRIMGSGKKATKRSVSETKKKFVASRQNWRCGNCQKQLTAWFEVDHKIRLEYGGSNHVDNLVALCRECHGEKTTMENL